MSSLFPILKDLVPMIMPSSVHVTKATELDEGTGQTEGMIRKGAIINKSDKVCASGKQQAFPSSSAGDSWERDAYAVL
jgi:hypothetical protein